jgi:hypothetical protein
VFSEIARDAQLEPPAPPGVGLDLPKIAKALEETEMTYTHESKKPTAAQREAQKAFRKADAKVAMSDYERDQKAFHANRERLRQERLAREAAATDDAAPK